MGKLRVSVVEYLNTAPLVWGFTRGPLAGRYELSFAVPAQCADDLHTGRADIGIIPAIEYQRMEGLVVLPGMAVAAKDVVRSILVIAKKPIEQARRFALDAGSRSSQALVRILCAERWRIQPEFVQAQPNPAAMLREADAALVIGDPALSVSVRSEAGQLPLPDFEEVFLYDVAHEWRAMTGQPCVLAIWAGRRERITPQVVADFFASKEYGLARIGEIADGAAGELNLPRAAMESYLRDNIDYGLDAENRAGLELYFRKCAALGLIPAAKPIDFAAVPAAAKGM